MTNQELVDWIAHDQSDYAQRVREAMRPSLQSLVASIGDFERLFKRSGYRYMMRRKIRRLVNAHRT